MSWQNNAANLSSFFLFEVLKKDLDLVDDVVLWSGDDFNGFELKCSCIVSKNQPIPEDEQLKEQPNFKTFQGNFLLKIRAITVRASLKLLRYFRMGNPMLCSVNWYFLQIRFVLNSNKFEQKSTERWGTHRYETYKQTKHS